MIRLTLPVAMFAGLMLTGCAKPVDVQHQGSANIQQDVRTYAVVHHPVGATLSTRHVFESLVHEAMAKKGYQKVRRQDADILVSFKALTASEGAEAPREAGDRAVENMTGSASGDDVDKVVLILLEEAATDRVLWVGWSSGSYPGHEVVQKTRESMAKILARIPERG